MAEIRAFRAFRYNLARTGALENVIAPPYDVIDPTLQQKLYEMSNFNAIRVELTKDEPGRNRYEVAAQTLRDWLADNVLQQDSARGLYIYEQQFAVEGVEHVRRGFFARLRIVPLGQGVFPHEQTLQGPKADRLSLYHATGFNLSPIFGLYPDDGSVFARLEPWMKKSPPLEATDQLGVTHRMWCVTDTATISDVVGMMGPKPIFIADGHHRYETAIRYRDEVGVNDPESAPNFCLMMFVGMSDPGLMIQPTHRLIRGLDRFTTRQLRAALAGHFEFQSDVHSARDCWETIELDGGQNLLGFGTTNDQSWFIARLRDTTIMNDLAPEHSPTWRNLGVSILHKLVIEQLLKTGICDYVHSLNEVEQAVQQQSCQVICLVPRVKMQHVETIASQHETMPPKSTYFYPKVATGLVFNSLKKD